MHQARWNEIETLFNTAVGMTGGERTAFLKEYCTDDPELRDEVAGLLAEADERSDFLERSVLKIGLRAVGASLGAASQAEGGREAA